MILQIDDHLLDRVEYTVVHADPLSKKTIAHLRRWIEICDKEHTECKRTSTSLPTRVLDIQDLQCIKLRESGLTNDRYIALSHCWGSCRDFLTTRATLASMREGFPVDQTPKSFRDAILVTSALGIRYLWIDSLCIIQGDISDWRIEASKMAQVYKNSFLTISAANSDDDANGFLSPRPFNYATVKFSSSVGKGATAYLNRFEMFPKYDDHDEPLDSRGWTLQEQYLSPRTVRYCRNQMTWNCESTVRLESETSLQRAITNTAETLSTKPWKGLVEAFSKRLLSYDTDKLSAMAGVASSISESRGGKYCAGLWWDSLFHDLLFKRENSQAPSQYLAPSWSWAALNGPVEYMGHGRMEYDLLSSNEPLGYNIKTSPENPYGQVDEGGFLELLVHLAPLQPATQMDRGIKGRLYFELVTQEHKGTNSEVWCTFDLPHYDELDIYALILAYEFEVPRPGAPIPGNPVPYSQEETAKLEPRNWTGLYGILICPTKHSRSSYRRVGSFEMPFLRQNEGLQIVSDYPVQKIVLY